MICINLIEKFSQIGWNTIGFINSIRKIIFGSVLNFGETLKNK